MKVISVAPIELISFCDHRHRMDKRKYFVFAGISRRINPLVPRNQPIKTAIGMVTHDFHGLKTMTFHRVADIAYF